MVEERERWGGEGGEGRKTNLPFWCLKGIDYSAFPFSLFPSCHLPPRRVWFLSYRLLSALIVPFIAPGPVTSSTKHYSSG